MPSLTPVDHDPFAQSAPATSPTLTPVDHDPFATASPAAASNLSPALSAALAQPQSMRQKAADVLSTLADGMTLGYADKAYAYLNGTTPEQERAITQAGEDRLGGVGMALKVGGVLGPALAGGELVSAGAGAARAIPMLGRALANPLVQGAATGAGVGAADAAGHDQPVASGAVMGAAGGAGGAALGAGVSRALGGLGDLFARTPPVMTSPELRAAAQAAYTDADNAGVVYTPQATARLDQAVRDHMANFGYAPELQPGGAAVLRALDRTDGNNATLMGVDTIRRTAGNMGSPAYPSAGALGSGIKGVVDDFTANPRPGDILMGNQQVGTDALANARNLYQRVSKDSDLADALGNAELRAGSTGSGGNINNATRQQVRSVYEGRNDWTPDEETALRRVIQGTPLSNTLRQIGKFSPEGNGLIAALELGGGGGAAVSGHPGALAVPAIGFAAKRAADALTARAAANAGTLIRSGGDAAALQGPPNVLQQFGAAVRRPIGNMAFGDYLAQQQPAAAGAR